MDENKIREIIRQEIENEKKQAQYGVSRVPYHIHNNNDSPQLAFTGLADTPSSYVGAAGKVATVNTSETALQFSTFSASPGGTDTNIQFNDSGSFGGDNDFSYDKTSNTVDLISGGTPGRGNMYIETELGVGVDVVLGGGLASSDLVWTITASDDVLTTTATITTLVTIPISSGSQPYYIEARIVGKRTGGSSGSAGDAAAYVRRGLYNNVSGTVNLIGSVQDAYTAESQAGWDVTYTISGTNVLIQVTGATNNNITWYAVVATLRHL